MAVVDDLYEIELDSDVGHYEFNTELSGQNITFEIKWNEAIKIWTADITNNTTDQVLGYGFALLLGNNIVGQHNFNIGTLFMVDIDDNGIDASDSDLGSRVKLFWSSTN